jgi:protein-tyrosine phosphatase
MATRFALDLDWVTPYLAVGGRFPIDAAEHLAKALGIGHVVDLRVETCDDERVLHEHGIELLHLPTQDTCGVSLPMLDDGVAWVTEKLARGLKVYVHCEHGIGRSALLALCVLVFRGEDPLQAMALLKRARRQASPSPEQLEAFRTWVSRRARAFPVPSLDALGRIAWAA